MKIQSSRFGELEIAPDDVVEFADGLLGFPACHRFTLLADPAHEPFMWMQSLDEPALAFVVIDPLLIEPDYRVETSSSDVEALALEDPGKARILVIVSIPEDPMDMTANLKGPLVINPESRKATQLVLVTDRYQTRHPVMKNLASRE